MPKQVVDSAIIVHFELEGETTRAFSTSEQVTFPAPISDADLALQAIYLAFARAAFLPDDVVIDKVRASRWDDPSLHIILNREPIEGKYSRKGGFVDVTPSASNTTIVTHGGTPGANNSITIPANPDLVISDPKVCLNFYLEGEEWMRASRQLCCIPDEIIKEIKAVGLPDNFNFLSDTPPSIDPAVLPVPNGNFYLNIRAYFDAIRRFCFVSNANPTDGTKLVISSLTKVLYRGVGTKAVGGPRKKYRGRAPISR